MVYFLIVHASDLPTFWRMGVGNKSVHVSSEFQFWLLLVFLWADVPLLRMRREVQVGGWAEPPAATVTGLPDLGQIGSNPPLVHVK